jgi:transposase-like protein
MKRQAKQGVTYTKSFKRFIVNAVMRDGFSIAMICTQHGVDEPNAVREWVREEMQKRGLKRIPRTLYKRGNAPKVLISEPINRQLQRYEEMLLYQECMIKSMLEMMDDETKKKAFSQLSPAQQRFLKRKGKH